MRKGGGGTIERMPIIGGPSATRETLFAVPRVFGDVSPSGPKAATRGAQCLKSETVQRVGRNSCGNSTSVLGSLAIPSQGQSVLRPLRKQMYRAQFTHWAEAMSHCAVPPPPPFVFFLK